jgi:hypothetical protein
LATAPVPNVSVYVDVVTPAATADATSDVLVHLVPLRGSWEFGTQMLGNSGFTIVHDSPVGHVVGHARKQNMTSLDPIGAAHTPGIPEGSVGQSRSVVHEYVQNAGSTKYDDGESVTADSHTVCDGQISVGVHVSYRFTVGPGPQLLVAASAQT